MHAQFSINPANRFQRTDALKIVNDAFPVQPVVVTLGGTVREMIAACGRQPNHLYILDSMGLVVPIAVGLALGFADDPSIERVVVVEGDGSLLMGFSVLSTIGLMQPKKLIVVILDNGGYLTTGGQPSASSSTDFVAAAHACGMTAQLADDPEALKDALGIGKTKDGPLLIRVPVGTVSPRTSFLLEDPVVLCEDFRRWLNSRRTDSGRGTFKSTPGRS
jgi:thiamine pyrophosphate-dependent acetolactate synthase large subunit-like protein